MRDLNDLYYFTQVVEHGGFAPAGRALGMPKSRLSRRIALLEARLGTRLIQRTTRSFMVTEIGQTYYTHCKAMLVEAEAADEAIARTRAEPCGAVRMTCPVALLDAQVGALVADFMVRYPQVQLQLDATNRRVDVVAEGIDVALRVRPPPLDDSDLVLRTLGERLQVLVASPALLQRTQVPLTPPDLSGLPSLALGSQLGVTQVWDLHGPEGEQAQVRHQPRLVSSSMPALREAAMAGAGIVQLPLMMVQAQLAAGQLSHVLPGWAPRPEIIHAVFASRRGLLPAVRALVDFLAEHLGEDPAV
ncbi:LysR family transcriptional regulator [Thiomonas bhubaneswarensis]|uniref:DNA-binding transcriptional regulator, LysR family n=1 Tax=Thiomonas bhubaneswarensis TaxID=339866 RepID=A0A0K6I5L1_9BURK|nr:LysR family transcriptional regulator [Thiomonas bhubaneswarensis]CUA98420.1 DNA-binding transcriptional regulator, LysR family [Thiomonas bhubaneswarensis]